MQIKTKLPETPVQRLPREAYISDDWLALERKHLFSRTWTFAGVATDFAEPGDYRTVQAGHHTLVVVKGTDGRLSGFHNICRHRGTELLEGCGNAGRTIVCPYHHWTYDLEGRLRGLPARKECFPDLDKGKTSLFRASVGVFQNLVFVHPNPEEPFEDWIGGLDAVPWPHDLSSGDLEENPDEIVYEMKCNWKVFYENAVDGYHLAYLHRKTLGGPRHDRNIWQAFGRHLVWWSTEREGVKHRIPKFVEKLAKDAGLKTVPGAEEPGYGGVYMLFPTTILLPSPWGISVSKLEPVDPGTTLLRIRDWAPRSWTQSKLKAKDIPGYDGESGTIKSSHWTKHPLEIGDFQTEDVWVCEKMQRAMNSPRHEVGMLAKGSGGEAALDFFQQCVLEFMPAGA